MSEELVIDQDASPELIAQAEAFQKEEQLPEATDGLAEIQPEEQPQAAQEEPQTEEQPQTDNPYSFKVKGEDKEFSRDQINNMLNREETFQKKFEAHRNSDEYKMAMVMAAAKGGDAQAQKKLKTMLSEMTDLEELDSVEGDYDVEKVHSEETAKMEEDAPFQDVKDDVDFQENFDRMQKTFSERLPSNIYDDYWNDPVSRRVMYDLERSGQAPEIFDAFEGELSGMSSLDRAKVKSDSTLYGNLFVEVLKSWKAEQGASGQGSQEPSNLNAVSSGDGSHSAPASSSEPDIENMSSEEFRKYSEKLLANAPREG